MFVDASALTAILVEEGDAHDLLVRLNRHPHRVTSPMAIWETVIAVARELKLPVHAAHEAVEGFVTLAAITVVSIPAETRFLAIQAFERYGKSRHPAALNFGDCFAYACAKGNGMPLLYKGNDFALTDVESA
ncbi:MULTISPECIES: type II toxin-antitoxin system VapC family toxin [Rhizobium]|uniref:Ribonuclease VapC n=1 Tax=Rhizobium metallidurans TaxID=1265931 RepID=A0A7W6CST9_9HYPH|nr:MULTISPECIES: type II toxin-antitoxin system VapC family toxin [Rhizobium]MBB3965564.1 ribonuclease VapC [Rhizobium metallidurans]